MSPSRSAILAVSLILVSLLLPAGRAGAAPDRPVQADVNLPEVDPDARLETILAHFDRAQASIQTLEAEFSERKELAMLVEPVLASGRFYYAYPNRAKWEYAAPDDRVFLISDNTLMQYFPEKKLLEKKDLRAANMSRVFKLFGMGQTSKELASIYRISLGQSEQEGSYLLVLIPRRKMVGKRLTRVLLWVGDRDFLPRAMKYEEADGDTTLLRFDNVRANTTLAESVFDLEVPDDVEISDKISMFSSGGR